MITYTETEWHFSSTTAGALLLAEFNTVYTSTFGALTVGLPSPGFSMIFGSAAAVQEYLPASGLIGPLDASLFDPTTSASGSFGGDVVGLQLNVDFSDAGFALGTLGIPFGSLILENFSTLPNLNGLTVRQFLEDVNTLLGAGSSIYTIAQLDPVAIDLNNSFVDGTPSTFAQGHLVAPTAPTPEPSSALLVGLGALGLGFSERLRRRRHKTPT